MPSRLEILAISALLYQTLPVALAAPSRIWGWDEETGAPAGYGNMGDADADEGQPGLSDLANLEHSLQQGEANGGPDDNDFGSHGGPPVTVTISDCTTAPTATATVTITMHGSSYGAGTVTQTVTNTITGGPWSANTVTNTLTMPASQCAGKAVASTETSTVTASPSTVTETASAAPTVTSTVTDSQYTTTESFTQTVTETKTNTETKTVTAEAQSSEAPRTNSNNNINFGVCTDATINYATGLQGHTDYTYTTNNQRDFPFGAALTIDSVEDYICTRLRSPCNAPQETIDRCYDAGRAVTGHSGQESARVWNELMG